MGNVDSSMLQVVLVTCLGSGKVEQGREGCKRGLGSGKTVERGRDGCKRGLGSGKVEKDATEGLGVAK